MHLKLRTSNCLVNCSLEKLYSCLFMKDYVETLGNYLSISFSRDRHSLKFRGEIGKTLKTFVKLHDLEIIEFSGGLRRSIKHTHS